MRLISASLTTQQIIESVQRAARGEAPLKDITRRLGWLDVEPGEFLCVCKKVMGRRRGQPLERIATVQVVSVRREPLDTMTNDFGYGCNECRREGFPAMLPGDFVKFFCATHKGCKPETKVTRIEFKYVLCSFAAATPHRCCQLPTWQSTFLTKRTEMFWCGEHGGDLLNNPTQGHGLVIL
jgi:hypothetical protein